MAFDITYTTFNGDVTKILIYRGTEGGYVNDYVTRVEADIQGYTYPDPYYEMGKVDAIDAGTGVGGNSNIYEGSSITAKSMEWADYSNWWIDFEIDGVRQDLVRYNLGEELPDQELDVDEGYFYADSAYLDTTDELQIAVWDADGNNNYDLLNSVVADRDVIRIYHYDMTPTAITPTLEGLDCLKYKIAVLEGTVHSFCGTDDPLLYKYHSADKYTSILASEIGIGVLIKDSTDNSFMQQILNGGYYVIIYKNNTAKWLGKLTSRFYVEAYAQYPYSIKLTGSDQLGSFERYQPLMIDFPIPNAKTSIISLLGRFLMDDSMYDTNYIGERIRNLYISSRFTNDNISKIASDLYLDPLNWMEDNTQYKSKKVMLEDILKALHAKILQWDFKWYIMDFEAQWDQGNITWNTYTLDDNGVATVGANFDQFADFVRPYVASPDDRQVYNNAEMRYEPSWRKLEMNLDYNERDNDIGGFTNILGNFYRGHDEVNLEFNDDGFLRYWSGGDFIKNQGGQNNGWMSIYRVPNKTEIQYINTVIPEYDYDTFIFNITLSASGGMKIPELNMNVKLTMGGDDKYLDNDAGDGDYSWNDNFRSIRLIGNGEHGVEIELPYTTVTSDITLYIAIHSIPYPHGAKGYVTARGLKADFTFNEWEAVEYKQELYKWINPTEGDTEIVDNTYNWGLYHDTLPNDNYFHRSGVYDSDGESFSKFDRDGEVANTYLMDWVGNIMIADNNDYTPTLTASYFSELTLFSLMVDAEGRVYRFVSGEFNDKISTWRNVYTEFKGLRNILYMPTRGDFLPLDFNTTDFYIGYSTLYLENYVLRVRGDGGTFGTENCAESRINELIL